ncbi:MAG: hypothetical protein ACLVJO_12160 [[Clostridium] scindens]
MEKIETALKLQGGSKSAIETASQCIRKTGTVALVGYMAINIIISLLETSFPRISL